MKKTEFLTMVMICFFIFAPTYASAACNEEENGIPERELKVCYGVSDNTDRPFQGLKTVAFFLLLFSIIPFVIGVKKIFKKDATKEEVNTGYWYCCYILIPIGIYLFAKLFEHLM